MEHDWQETHEALKVASEYDKTFDALIKRLIPMTAAKANKAFTEWNDKYEALALKAGEAFIRATSYINGMDKAKFADIESISRISNYKEN